MQRSLDELAEEITTLAAHVNAATCRWLELIAEFDERGGWAQWGCRSCAHWVAWRCSIVAGAAREHVRVARRLRELPLIRAAFARGELSYSKVRAVTRVLDVEDEQNLLELALDSTAAQLERLIRAYRGVAAVEAGHRDAARDRFVSWHFDDDGALVLRGRLPAEEGAMVVAALEATRERLAGDAQPPRRATGVDTVVDGGDAPPDLEANRADPNHADLDHADPDHADRAHADHDHADADADPAYAEPQQPVEAHPAEVEPARARGASNADALLALVEAELDGVQPGRSTSHHHQVLVHVDVATLVGGDAATAGALQDGVPLPAETVRRLCCDAGVTVMAEHEGRTVSIGRRSRSVPPPMRQALLRRDRGCRFPGCTQHRRVDAHHIRHWAAGGETSLDNLTLLCRHHHRLVHEEGYSVESRGRGRVVFRRPDGRRLRHAPPRRRGDAAHLRHLCARAGLAIDHTTAVPSWAGDRLDLDAAVQRMLTIAPITEPPGI